MTATEETRSDRITDYDLPGWDYIRYWCDRQYEHQAEEKALKKLLPREKENVVDLGGGYGRLTPFYARYFSEVLILDYSQKHLRQAEVMVKSMDLKGVETKQGDIYNLPLKSGRFEVGLMVRVMHHLEDPRRVLEEVFRILKPGGVFILEFPNKCHFKAGLRSLLRLNPGFCLRTTRHRQPAAGTEGIFYNYHPRDVYQMLEETGFEIERRVSASNLRSPLLKKLIPLPCHLFLESLLQWVATPVNFGPSIFLRCRKPL